MPETLDIWPEDRISYRSFAERLFDKGWGTIRPWNQNLVPFLGAGASLGPPEHRKEIENASPLRVVKQLDELFETLEIQSKNSRSLIEFAVILAQRLDDELMVKEEMWRTLNEAQYPPSANELVRLFCEFADYKPLRDAAVDLKSKWADELAKFDNAELTDILTHFVDLTGIRRYTESLTSISSYFETQYGREELWRLLHRCFGRKTTPTPTHRLVARSAKFFLSQQGHRDGTAYVVLTTNYDCLMEYALDELNEPYAVLTVDDDGFVQPYFSKDLEHLREASVGQRPRDFYAEWPALVIVYKIHGSIQADDDPRQDNLIISEDDYARYLANLGGSLGAFPAQVAVASKDRPFLFLGYSLSDWNVRAVLESIRRDKNRNPLFDIIDYAVLRDVAEFQRVYFRRKNVRILKTDLDSFVGGIQQYEPPAEENA